jgi:tetratricopeptide (TPR) repeat protein
MQAAAPGPASLEGVERLLAQGRYQPALEHLERTSPKSARWHFLASKAWDGLDDPARAVEEAEAALALDPAQEPIYLHLGQIFLTRHTPAAALEVFSEAHAIFPDSLLLRLGKGLALKELQRWEEAESELAACLARKPDLGIAFDALGAVLIQTKRFEALEKASLAFGSAAPADFRGPYYLGEALYGLRRDPDQAERLARQAIERQPSFAAAHGLLGRLMLAAGRPAEAVPALEEAVRLRPGFSQFHFHLARAYRAMGDQERAAAALEAHKNAVEKENQPFLTLRYRRGQQQ